MAISAYASGFLLDGWRQYPGEDIWKFNQVMGAGVIIDGYPVYIQDQREMIGNAVAQAHEKMHRELHFAPSPVWVQESMRLPHGININTKHLMLSNGYIRAIGKRAKTLIEAGVAVTYSDVGGLGVNDTATITITVVTPPAADEIGLFFRTADGSPSAGDWQYRIEPVKVTVSGTTVTITGDRALFVKPSEIWHKPYTTINNNVINTADTIDAADFVTLVDVYRAYADPTAAVQLIGNGATGDSSTVLQATAQIVNADEGVIKINAPAFPAGFPLSMDIYYQAGYPLNINGQMDVDLWRATMRLANTLMARRWPSLVDRNYDTWAHDGETDNATQTQVDEGFGARFGEIAAWRTVQQRELKCRPVHLWRYQV